MSIDQCPLCLSKNVRLLLSGGELSHPRDFLHCGVCDLVFVPGRFHLDAKAEKERYLQHNNDPDQVSYQIVEVIGCPQRASTPSPGALLNAGASGTR